MKKLFTLFLTVAFVFAMTVPAAAMDTLPIPAPITLGNVAGVGSDGVILGVVTATDPTVVLEEDDTTLDDETTDATDAGAGDFELWPSTPVAEEDGLWVGYSEKFCKIKLTYSQAATGTAIVMTPQYWDGTQLQDLTTYEDDTAAYVTAAGTLYIHFVPPTDWVSTTTTNGPDNNAAYFIFLEFTSATAVTQQPLGTQLWVYPLKTNASGAVISSERPNPSITMSMMAHTASGANNDSVFLLVNATDGTYDDFTWTKADVMDSDTGTLAIDTDDELMLIQITEDGTTEFADAVFFVGFQ